MNVYVIQRSAADPNKWDVVRNAPTVISKELKHHEAETLAFAMNTQINRLEGRGWDKP